MAETPGSTEVPPMAPARPPRTSRVRVAVVAGVLLVLGAAAATLFSFGAGSPADHAPYSAPPPPYAPPSICNRMATPGGSDLGSGTPTEPFRSVQHLVDALQPGETGCLAAGEYSDELTITRGGQPGRPITLAAAGSDRPTVDGRVTVADSANHVVITGLTLKGRNRGTLPSPTINGDNVVLRDNEITNDNSGICLNVGHDNFGVAADTVIEGNRIHHCGELPRTNLEHGIYIGVARNTLIRNNLIYANADRGIQLYPDAQRTRIVHNVIDGNGTGVIFSGAGGTESSHNYVGQNIISNSERFNIDAYWDESVGTGNVVEDNCLWAGGMADVSDIPGFTEEGNVIADPWYSDRDRAVFAHSLNSPCAGYGPVWEPR